MRFFVILATLLFYGSAIAQKGSKYFDDPQVSPMKEFKLEAKKMALDNFKLPFSSIKIIDSRFDTSKLGFGYSFFGAIRKITFKGGVSNALENYYNEYYKNSFTNNGFQLVIIMKRFWESMFNNTRSQNPEVILSSYNTIYAYLKWEYCIAKDGQYLPVKRVDTIISMNEELSNSSEGEFESSKLEYQKIIFKTMIEMHDFNRPIALFAEKNKKNIEEINAFNEQRFLIPVLQTDTIKKGIYLTFDEFKNNKPSIVDYKEKKMRYGFDKKRIYLTTIEGEPITNYWGYADEDGIRYGKYGNDRLFRFGNTFQFFIRTESVNFDNSTPVTTKSRSKVKVPYQIDMETGLVY